MSMRIYSLTFFALVSKARLLVMCFCLSLSPALVAKSVVLAIPDEGNDPFWNIVLRGCKDASKMTGIELRTIPYDSSSKGNALQAIDLALSKPSDGVIVVLHDNNPTVYEHLSQASSQKLIQVINSGESIMSESSFQGNFIGMNDYQAGTRMGENLQRLSPKSLVFISHLPMNTNVASARLAGLQSMLPDTKIQTIDTSSADPIITIRRSLEQASDYGAIVTLGSLSFSQYAEAVSLKGKPPGARYIATFDLSTPIAAAMLSGHVLFAVDQQPYLQGYLAVINAHTFADYRLHPVGRLTTGPMVVYPRDAEKIYDEIGSTR